MASDFLKKQVQESRERAVPSRTETGSSSFLRQMAAQSRETQPLTHAQRMARRDDGTARDHFAKNHPEYTGGLEGARTRAAKTAVVQAQTQVDAAQKKWNEVTLEKPSVLPSTPITRQSWEETRRPYATGFQTELGGGKAQVGQGQDDIARWERLRQNPDFAEVSKARTVTAAQRSRDAYDAGSTAADLTTVRPDTVMYDTVNVKGGTHKDIDERRSMKTTSGKDLADIPDEVEDLYYYIRNKLSVGEAQRYLESTGWAPYYTMEPVDAFAQGATKGVGAQSLLTVFNRIAHGKESAEGLQKALDELNAKAQKDHPVFSGAGNVVGTTALAVPLALGGGAAAGAAGLGGVGTAVVSGAAGMGGATAIQEAGDLASGRKDVGRYLWDVVGSGFAGAAGSGVSYGLGKVGSAVLQQLGLADNSLARGVVGFARGGGSAATRVGITEGVEYLQDPDGYEFNAQDALNQVLVSGAFDAITSAVTKPAAPKTAMAVTAQGTRMSTEEDLLLRQTFGENYQKMSADEIAKAYRTLAHANHPDLVGSAGEEAMKRLNTARDIYQRFFSGEAHTAYQAAQAARASGDTAAYRQAVTDFANSVNGLQTIIGTGTSTTPEVAEAMQILNAVSASMGRDMEMKSGGGNVSIDLAPGMEATPTLDELVATDSLKEYNIITTQGGVTEHGEETRQEDRQAFRQRSASEGITIIEGDAADYGYKRVSGTAQRAEQVQAELEKLGIEVDVIDGTVWRNQGGVSVKRTVSEAVTIGGRKVLVSSSATLPAKYVAGHEAFHRWKNTPGRQRYIDTLEENLDFSSRAFLNYQSEIAKAYLGGEVDLTDSAQLQALQEELFAYLSGDLHEGGHDEELRLMFRDFDAVKGAWAALVAQQTKWEKVAFDGLAPAVKAPTKTPAQLSHEAQVLSGLPLVEHLGSFGRTGLTHLLESRGAVGDSAMARKLVDGYAELYLAGFARAPMSQDLLPADATPATRRLTAPERLQAYYNGLNDAGVTSSDHAPVTTIEQQISENEGRDSVPKQQTDSGHEEKAALTEPETGSKIGESKGKGITAITDEAIGRVPVVQLPAYTTEQCETIRQQHQALLQYAREENQGKEVAFVFRPGLTDRQVFTGSDDALDFGSSLSGTDLIVMHNHPRNSSFSYMDITFMLRHDGVKCLTIVKNNGDVEILIKTDAYDKRKAETEMQRYYKRYVITGEDQQITKAVQKFLKKGQGGFRWMTSDGC